MTETVIVPSKQELVSDVQSWAPRARSLQIVDRESCIHASELLRSIKMLRSQVQTFWARHIDAAMEAKRKAEDARKGLVGERDQMEAPLVEAESILKRGLLAWETEQERVRQEQERALQAEAQRQAEEATLAASAALELEATTTGNAEMLQEARDILEQPIEAPVVVVKSLAPKVAGITYLDRWKAHPEIDVKSLAAAVGSGKVPANFLTPNLTAINQFARATQGAEAVPGVRFYNDRTIAARA